MSDPKHRIQRILTLIPYLRNNPGVRVEALEAFCGAPASEILADLNRILLCGVPPYLPHNYFVFQLEGDRVRIKFAEHLRRPVHLTLQEALAIGLALRGVGSGHVPPFGDAAARLRDKLRAVLKGGDRAALDALDRGVAGKPVPAL